MTNNEIRNTITSLNEWEALAKEASDMIESLKDSLKAELVARDTEELDIDSHIIRYTTVSSNRFDTSSFKKNYGELYKAYTKQVTSRRFSISA